MTQLLVKWLLFAVATPGRRRALIAEYRQVPLFVLADIAHRGGLYAHSQAADAVTLARDAGRRDLALEIIGMAQADAATLIRHLEKVEPKERTRE